MTGTSPARAPVEMVERKGVGHPDTMCDALAESLSMALCRYYRDHFGLILHHNVDKALLWGGVSEPAFGGGQVITPMEIFLAGRATDSFKGKRVPVSELVIETSRQWLRDNLHALDADRHVSLHTMIRPGSRELVELYLRQKETGVALANDTSCGVGYAPLDELEQLVLAVEQHLNSSLVKQAHPDIGEDIKVMGVRDDDGVALTVGCAFVDRYVASIKDYMAKKDTVATLAQDVVQRCTNMPVSIAVNTADGTEPDSLYLTVTGTSAEAGDDGEVGRGNRVNGLITPYRPMNMEAAAGKNPVTHVGKLYNIVAKRVAAELVNQIDDVQEANCYLVSRIGHPVTEPQVVDVRLRVEHAGQVARHEGLVRDIVRTGLKQAVHIQDDMIAGAIKVY
jgi:S-adenosylmethionine synthetase